MCIRDRAVTAKQAVLDPRAGLIEVDSAFGGLAIYRREAFLAGRYAGTDKHGGFDVADHIPFHEDLRAQGYKIFINCSLVNCARYPDAVESPPPQKPRGTLKVIQRLGQAVFGKKRFYKYLDLMKTPYDNINDSDHWRRRLYWRKLCIRLAE